MRGENVLQGGGGRQRPKNPWNFCEELEGYPDSCNSNKLDSGSLMTSSPLCSFPASQFCRSGEQQSGAGGRRQGHSAAGYTPLSKCALIMRARQTHTSTRLCVVLKSHALSLSIFQCPDYDLQFWQRYLPILECVMGS